MAAETEGTNGTVENIGNRNKVLNQRNRSRAWCFTKDNATKEDVGTFIKYFQLEDMDYMFQMEKGEKTGMIHLQGVCRFKNPRDRWPELKAHWDRCRSWKKSIIYCSKTDTRIEGPWTNLDIKVKEKPQDYLKDKELYPFQAEILMMLGGKIMDRTIFWYFDEKGNTGKSTLVRHILLNNQAICRSGSGKDCYCALKLRCEDNKEPNIVIFDLTRDEENKCNYKVIETIKNGVFFSGKYESKDIIINPPHVIVFSNWKPKIDKLSKDRWSIHEIKRPDFSSYPIYIENM
ncbi:MAG: Rep protein [CRESS virus sp. ctBNR11]|nr:MAG: Rep protein [CRESS virus sp. ctBNR11]